jgi:hypothetical protein
VRGEEGLKQEGREDREAENERNSDCAKEHG